MSESNVPPGDKEMSFWDHVAELSIRLRRIFIAVILVTFGLMILPSDLDISNVLVLFTGDWMKYRPLVAGLLSRIRSDILPESVLQNSPANNSSAVSSLLNATIIYSGNFASALTVYIEGSIIISLAITAPYIAYELYMFIAPGLYPHEKKFIKSFILSFTFLFVLGVLYGYYILMPITFKVLLYFPTILGVVKWFDIVSFYHMIFLGLALNGLFFTMPVFLVLAMKFGVIPPEMLINNKRYIYVAVLVITAIITPDPTPVSMILLSLPFIVLYEVSIYLGKRVYPSS